MTRVCHAYDTIVRMHDIKPESIDLSRALNHSHENKWVALTPDYSKVVAASDDLIKLDKAVAGRDVVYHRVLPADVIFAPRSASGV